MTVVTIKPAKNNSIHRRYAARGELMAKHRENAELARKISKAWAKLTNAELPIHKEEHIGSRMMPDVYILKAGYRKGKVGMRN